MSPPPAITAYPLLAIDKVRHGFFTREGGVSQGLYASLNCGPGSNDSPENVRKNRALVTSFFDLPEERLNSLYQVHSDKVLFIDKPLLHPLPQADGLVTRTPGLILGVLSADCAPVLLASAKPLLVGAVHAGWKGAQAGVLEAALRIFQEQGANPKDITAAIGPCIAQRSYEVGPEFPQNLGPGHDFFFAPSRNPGKFMFDLAGYVAYRLEKAGIGNIWTSPCDTMREEGRFFSYRRTTLRKEPDYGRQISAIAID